MLLTWAVGDFAVAVSVSVISVVATSTSLTISMYFNLTIQTFIYFDYFLQLLIGYLVPNFSGRFYRVLGSGSRVDLYIQAPELEPTISLEIPELIDGHSDISPD